MKLDNNHDAFNYITSFLLCRDRDRSRDRSRDRDQHRDRHRSGSRRDDRDKDHHRHRSRDRDDYERSRRRDRDSNNDKQVEEGEIKLDERKSPSEQPSSVAMPEIERPPSAVVEPAQPKPQPMQRPIRKRPLTAAFADDEEEDETDKKSRKLIPIQYSAEELQAVRESGPGSSAALPAAPSAVPREAPAAFVNVAEERKKRIMANVPKNQDDIFAYPVKWEMLDKAPQETKSKLEGRESIQLMMGPMPHGDIYFILWPGFLNVLSCYFIFAGWIHKKVKPLLGDDEHGAVFADFIVQKLHSHCSAANLVIELQEILEDDAVTLVMQLFKVRVMLLLSLLNFALEN